MKDDPTSQVGDLINTDERGTLIGRTRLTNGNRGRMPLAPVWVSWELGLESIFKASLTLDLHLMPPPLVSRLSQFTYGCYHPLPSLSIFLPIQINGEEVLADYSTHNDTVQSKYWKKILFYKSTDSSSVAHIHPPEIGIHYITTAH